MNETVLLILSSLAVIIIVTLIAYALMLNRQLSVQKLDAEKEATSKKKQQSETIYSIKLIAITAINGELNLTEACIRVAALTDALQLTDQQKNSYSETYRLANATYNIPRNQAWQDLPKLQRLLLREEMVQLEADAKEDILKEFEIIVKKTSEGSFIYQA
jgi:hypothetical protein|tara:strand:- start:2432 stop:2911 length:480 start_codon:yes stop_codon:yes gene_type:complete